MGSELEATDVVEDPSGMTYRKTGTEVVLGGWVPGGNHPVVMTLPEGFRPALELSFSARRDTGKVAEVHISPDGTVATQLGSGSVNFEDISYRVA